MKIPKKLLVSANFRDLEEKSSNQNGYTRRFLYCLPIDKDRLFKSDIPRALIF